MTAEANPSEGTRHNHRYIIIIAVRINTSIIAINDAADYWYQDNYHICISVRGIDEALHRDNWSAGNGRRHRCLDGSIVEAFVVVVTVVVIVANKTVLMRRGRKTIL